MAEKWDDKFDYLSATRSLYHNQDCWRFLVRDVWGIDHTPCSVVDFGCGFGWMGLFLMPMLAAGSRYIGIDLAEPLLRKGASIFAVRPWQAGFVRGDASAAPIRNSRFDVAIAHTLMMHLPEPRRALAEMIRVTRDGGLLIACEVNRNAINALMHVHETDEQDYAPLAMHQAMNGNTRCATGVDYNIGMKMPVLMHHAGLRDVQARISDAVRLSFPPLDTPEKQQVFEAICDDGLGVYPTDDQTFDRFLAILTARGAPVDEAATELRREMHNDYRRTGRRYHIVQPGLITISSGTVAKR
jgi:SAM-dependent methyltransferase